jgi:phosphoglycerate dehydrogenase-like enzyme
VFGDSAYADGATLDRLAEAGHEVFAKVPPVRNSKGYSKDEFSIDPHAGTATCPARHTVAIRARRDGATVPAGRPASRPGAPTARCAQPAPPHGRGG